MGRSSLVPPSLQLPSPAATRAASSLPLEKGPLKRFHAFDFYVRNKHNGGSALPHLRQLTSSAASAKVEPADAVDAPIAPIPRDIVAGGAAVCSVHPLEGFLRKDGYDQWLQVLRANCAGLPLPRLRLWGESYREIIPLSLPPPLQLSVSASLHGWNEAAAQNSPSLSGVTSVSAGECEKNALPGGQRGPPIPREVLLGLSWVRGVTQLLPVQQLALPLFLQRETDVLLGASAGTGKTLAAAITVLTRLVREWGTSLKGKPKRGKGVFHPCESVGALVLTPTKDAALQTLQMLRGLGRYTQLRVGLLVGRGPGEEGGGRTPWRCFSELQRQQPHVVVCTPGKAEELVQFLLAAAETGLEKTGQVREGIADLLNNCMQLVVDDAGLQLQEPLMLRAIAKLKEVMPPGHQCIMLSSSLSWELQSCAARLMRVGALCLNCLEGPPALTVSCLLNGSETKKMPHPSSSPNGVAAAAAADSAPLPPPPARAAAAAAGESAAVQTHSAAAGGMVRPAAERERAARIGVKGETRSAVFEVMRGSTCILDLHQPQVLWGPKRSREFLAKKRYEASREMRRGVPYRQQSTPELHGAPHDHHGVSESLGPLDLQEAPDKYGPQDERVASGEQGGAPKEQVSACAHMGPPKPGASSMQGASNEQGAPTEKEVLSEQGPIHRVCDRRPADGDREGGLRLPEEFVLYPPELHGHVLFNVLANEAQAAAAASEAKAAAATATAAAATTTAGVEVGSVGIIAPFNRVLVFFDSTKSLQFHYALFKHFVIPNANRLLQMPSACQAAEVDVHQTTPKQAYFTIEEDGMGAATAASGTPAAATAAPAPGSPCSLEISSREDGWPTGVPLPMCFALHSKLTAEKRRVVIDAFSSDCLYTREEDEGYNKKSTRPRRLKVLFCTDVAAVGVQLGNHVSLILQVGAPRSVEVYTQRAARAPRLARKLLLLSDLDGHFLYESYKAMLPLHEAPASTALPLLRFNGLFAAALGGSAGAVACRAAQQQQGPLEGPLEGPSSRHHEEAEGGKTQASPNCADAVGDSRGGVSRNAGETLNVSAHSPDASAESCWGVQTANDISVDDSLTAGSTRPVENKQLIRCMHLSSPVDSGAWYEVKPLRASCELMYRSLLGMYAMQASRLKFERWQVPSFLNAMLQSIGVDEPPAVTKQMAARLQLIHAPGKKQLPPGLDGKINLMNNNQIPLEHAAHLFKDAYFRRRRV
ncbi:hypothetical protein ACSSS7_006447 [Eimeria intestinalis]